MYNRQYNETFHKFVRLEWKKPDFHYSGAPLTSWTTFPSDVWMSCFLNRSSTCWIDNQNYFDNSLQYLHLSVHPATLMWQTYWAWLISTDKWTGDQRHVYTHLWPNVEWKSSQWESFELTRRMLHSNNYTTTVFCISDKKIYSVLIRSVSNTVCKKIPGCPTASVHILQFAIQHALLAILPHNPLQWRTKDHLFQINYGKIRMWPKIWGINKDISWAAADGT